MNKFRAHEISIIFSKPVALYVMDANSLKCEDDNGCSDLTLHTIGCMIQGYYLTYKNCS